MPGPLAGVRVVEMCVMAAGPWTGVLLAELGADVIKIEPPTGDGTRWVHPTQQGMGTNFISMNLGKRDVTFDLKTETDRETVRRMLAEADVFLQNLSGGVAERLGMGYQDASRVNPGLVYCSISGFGSTGPLAKARCSDAIMQAFSGFARLNGPAGSQLEQFRFTGFIDLVTAAIAAQSIVAALLHRRQTGCGQHVDVSMLAAALEIQHTRFSEYLGCDHAPVPVGSESTLVAPDRAFRAVDTEVFVTVHDDAEWAALCEALGRLDLGDDERFATNGERVANRATLTPILEEIFAAKPALWWQRRLARAGLAVAVATALDAAPQHLQPTANRMIAEVDTPWGRVSVGGAPWHFSRTPARVDPPPVPGKHTASVARHAWSAPPAATPRTTAAGRNMGRPLGGVRVVELTSGVAGALAAMRLQDLGADTIKVEHGAGDWLRHGAPRQAGADVGAAFSALNRGKRSVYVDLDEDRQLLVDLVTAADVVISDDLDAPIGAELADVRARSERGDAATVWIELSDFGAVGPLARHRGSELTTQAMGGYTQWLGRAGEDAVRLGADVASCATGIFAAGAALAALFWRSGGGSGQLVRLSRLNSLFSLASIHLAAQTDPDSYDGQRVGGAFYPPLVGWRTGERPIVLAFGGSVGPNGRPGWVEFIKELGADWILTDPRFADDPTGHDTTGHGLRTELCREPYEVAFAEHSDEELVALIRKHGGQAASFLDYDDLARHEQVKHLELIRAVGANNERVLSYPARFSRFEIELRGGVSDLGADTKIIRDELGL